jgi:hypothetical protein
MNFPVDNNGCIWWFCWLHATGEEVAKELKRSMRQIHCKKLYICGFEEYDMVYLFCTNDEYKDFIKYAESCNVEVVVIRPALLRKINNRHYLTKGKQLIQFMHYFASRTVHYNVDMFKPIQKITNPTKLYTSLNHRGHPHRCLFIDIMHKQEMQKYGHVSWAASDICIDYEWQYFTEYQTPLKLDWNAPDGEIFYPPNHFQDSVLSVVCESNLECIFLTEKTYMPIIHKRPFITFSVPNYHKALQELGFELFDNIFDYSFDSIDDDVERCNAMWEQVKRYTDYDLQRLYECVKPKVNYNFQHLMDIIKDTESIFDQSILQDFKTTNNQHFKNNYKQTVFFEDLDLQGWIDNNG